MKKITPFPFQITGANFLADRPRACLFDEMGVGKTVQAILAVQKVESKSVIVICPKIAKDVWRRHFEMMTTLKPVCLEGRTSFRWPQENEAVITNYDILPDHPGIAPPNVVLIADEAHFLKTSTSTRTKRFRLISQSVSGSHGHVWLLTGTPWTNKPTDLWNVLQAAALARTAFDNFPNFKELFDGQDRMIRARGGRMVRITEWGKPAPCVPDLLRKVALWRHRKEVLPELPDKRIQFLQVDCMTPEAKKICDEMVDLLRKDGKNIDDALEHVIATRNGVVFEQMSRIRSLLSVLKIKALQELLDEHDECESPLVVFSAHRAPIDTLTFRRGWRTITGSTPQHQRLEIEQLFQDGKLNGIGATITAACTALTLTRAHEVIFCDLDWTPANNQQAEDRVCRIGQNRGVIITRLVANHQLDHHVLNLLSKKQAAIEVAFEKKVM